MSKPTAAARRASVPSERERDLDKALDILTGQFKECLRALDDGNRTMAKALCFLDRVETATATAKQAAGETTLPSAQRGRPGRDMEEFAEWLTRCRLTLPRGEPWPCVEELLVFVTTHRDGPKRPMSRMTMHRYRDQAEREGIITTERRGRFLHMTPGPNFPAHLREEIEAEPESDYVLADIGEQFAVLHTRGPKRPPLVLIPYEHIPGDGSPNRGRARILGEKIILMLEVADRHLGR